MADSQTEHRRAEIRRARVAAARSLLAELKPSPEELRELLSGLIGPDPFEAFRAWFHDSGAAAAWDGVDDVETELGRDEPSGCIQCQEMVTPQDVAACGVPRCPMKENK